MPRTDKPPASVLPNVLAAKGRLTEGLRNLHLRHQAGCPGVELCGLVTDLRDEILLELFDAALADLNEAGPGGLPSQIALVAHGGYGRRDVAPYSDVDLMILHARAARQRVVPLAERLLRDVFDAGLILGHSVRTADQATQLACQDAVIASSLIESRLLGGSEALFAEFTRAFRRQLRRQPQKLMTAMIRERRKEQGRYGETVYLLEPNVKRSRGALRDLHLLRWIGFVRYGTREPGELHSLRVLTEDDVQAIAHAGEFLLRLRNEMHFDAGKPADVLDRPGQLRIAEQLGSQPAAGMLPVEQFMREYFRHTNHVSHVATRFVANARSKERLTRWVTAVFGHQVEQDLRVGPAGILATSRGLQQLPGDLTAIVRMADLANLYNKPIAPETWEAVRQVASGLPQRPPAEACRYFVSLLKTPGRLGSLLRDLHDTGVLERFVPALAHARGLLQFNQYHKYTVDEHCLRAVEFATKLLFDMGPLGRTYRRIPQKHVLHLALLIHDLGKGFEEDHCTVGLRIAEETAARLGLSQREAEALTFLVHQHLSMNHLAFRRDTDDEQLVLRFAREVGSPELLQMLFVLTAADLAAVGPGVWDGWKAEIVADLYHRTMQHLAGESPDSIFDEPLRQRRRDVAALLASEQDQPWFARQLDALPAGYLNTTEAEQLADDLRLLRNLAPGDVVARGRYLLETQTVQFTVGTDERLTPGVFHKLTGALTSLGLEIRSAEINTLTDHLVLDRFCVHDGDFAGEPPPERIEQAEAALVQSLREPSGQPPSFRRRWTLGGQGEPTAAGQPARVNVDNATSDRCTILDVFAHDRTGLLYAIARTLFELGVSVERAKIGTHLDQVVDVFYVTDGQGRKIEDDERLGEIRRRLLAVIERPEEV